MLDLLLLSTSTVHGSGFLDYAEGDIVRFLDGRNSLLFIPFARPGGMSHDEYTTRVRERLGTLGVAVTGIHETPDPHEAILQTDAVFVGGGNTFVLLGALYRGGLLEPIRELAHAGTPYIGSSAGSNVAGLTIGTTNDMPIVHPPSLDALGLMPFNLNPHYVDPDPESTHMGETRETRIREFHAFNEQPVLGLREGAMLRVQGGEAKLWGVRGGRLFRQRTEPTDLEPDADVSFLMRS